MGDSPAARQPIHEVVFWCRNDLCFCSLGHHTEVDEHRFHKMRNYYSKQNHDVVVRFTDVVDAENLPDWDLDDCELINDD